ncbi:MAG: DUF1461 domain-containing protein [Chloroflexota bacterium]|nr:MAG: DUF1461 domain-containing protein [Chloroflexota bacterium]
MRLFPGLLSIAVALSAGLLLLAVAISPFLTPAWVAFEQDRAEAAAWTSFSPVELRTATDAILSDLVAGPPAFDVTIRGAPVLTDAERSHMRDVRAVFTGFFTAAGAGLVLLVIARLATRPSGAWSRDRFLGAVRAGATGLAVVIAVAGVIAAVAFDAAFEVFHQLFFAAGTYNFDPTRDRLVQLFPEVFWSETTMAVGGLTIALSLVVVVLTTRGLRRAATPTAAAERAVA